MDCGGEFKIMSGRYWHGTMLLERFGWEQDFVEGLPEFVGINGDVCNTFI